MASATVGQETAQIIRVMDEDFVRNVNSSNADALVAAFYAEDAELLPPHAPLVMGRAAIRDFWSGMISAGLKLSVLKAKRMVESGSLAYASGVYELTISSLGKEAVSDKGKYVVVYRRQEDGAWKAVADIFNSSLPAT